MTMTKHTTGTREQWLAARLKLLDAEKVLTRQSDELARRRQELPWVRVEKDYRFDTDEGKASLADLFGGRSQLLVYHFMFGPDYKAGCPSCSSIADGFNGIAIHLANHDVMPWASSQSGDFNYDFNVSITEEQQRTGGGEYNYRRGGHAMTETTLPPVVIENAARTGAEPAAYMRERPGVSAFVLEVGVVYHTYSTYARGLDGLWGVYQWLDRAPKGRNETGVWWRHHDRYDHD
jgi:predicted dithiol-disulfide oxidoreductase (DUF899 family)